MTKFDYLNKTGEIVLQMSVKRNDKPPYDYFVTIEKQPANKHELLDTMAHMADRSKMTFEYLVENLETEELR